VQLEKGSLGNRLVVQWLGLGSFHCWGPGLMPGQETKMPQAMWHGQKERKNPSLFNMLSRFVISLEEGPEKFGTWAFPSFFFLIFFFLGISLTVVFLGRWSIRKMHAAPAVQCPPDPGLGN